MTEISIHELSRVLNFALDMNAKESEMRNHSVEVYEKELKLIEAKSMVDEITEEMESIEIKTESEVVNAKDESGKASFTNDTARKNETKRKLLMNSKYQELRKEYRKADREHAKINAAMKSSERMFNMNRDIVRAMGGGS